MGDVVVEPGDGGVARIVMRDPAGRNGLDEALREAIAAGLRRLYQDAQVRAIVIGGEGRNFSVGGDLSQIAGHVPGQASHRMMRSVGDLALLAGSSPKPLVAAVSGHCLGAGAGLALLCDTIVMGRSATIGFPFLKVGLIPDFGVSYTLPRRIGPVAARRALIEGRSFGAEEALAMGLADAVAEDEAVWDSAVAEARMLAEAPAAALMQLRLMLRQPPTSLAAALEAEALNQALCLGSDDMREGVAAFREKRKADFVGPAAGGGK